MFSSRLVAHEIIGVVKDSRYRSLTEIPRPAMLLPAWQHYAPDLSLHLRSTVAPAPLVEAVRRELRALDAQLPLTRVRTLAEQRRNSLYAERVTALLLATFGGLALLLAALGIYGLMAYAVAQRTREIGLRMALGAQGADVLTLFLRQGLWLILIGVGLGLIGALAAARLVKSFLYEVSATDPLTFTGIALLLIAIALLACWIPARRATKVDPMIALRCE